MNSNGSILLIEDEPHIRHFVRAALREENWQVFEADNVQRGLIEASSRHPDLLILDLGLPDRDGVEFIRDYRAWSSAPILVLSARTAEEEKIAALDAGADDYLAKPFGVGELLARIRALARRLQRATEEALLQFGSVQIDYARRQVTQNNEEIHLTPHEYRLLVVLTANAGKVLTHRFLMQEVWGPGHSERAHYLRIYLSRLRQKLEQDPAQPRHFLTETAVGYRFQP